MYRGLLHARIYAFSARIEHFVFFVCTMSQDADAEDVKPKLNLIINYEGQRGSRLTLVLPLLIRHRHHRQSEAKHALSKNIRGCRGV